MECLKSPLFSVSDGEKVSENSKEADLSQKEMKELTRFASSVRLLETDTMNLA